VAGDTPAEAVTAFVRPIQRAVSCFVSGKVTADRTDPAAEGTLLLNRNAPVRLPGGAKIDVEIGMKYRVVQTDVPDQGPWKVRTTQWIYHMQVDGEPKVQYHWHPETNVKFPHVHFGNSGPHHPTGRILIEDVLQAAVEYGATPRDGDEWAAIRAENHAMFHRGATWGHGPDLTAWEDDGDP